MGLQEVMAKAFTDFHNDRRPVGEGRLRKPTQLEIDLADVALRALRRAGYRLVEAKCSTSDLPRERAASKSKSSKRIGSV